ncbi:hypothetical protein MTO96_022606 [Rhipicephalus appendiculatus]
MLKKYLSMRETPKRRRRFNADVVSLASLEIARQQRKSRPYPDRKLLGSLWGPEDSGEDLPLPCPADPAGLIDCKHARLWFRPSAAVRPYSPDEEDVLVADVCVSSLPSTGLLHVTSSAPTMQQQRADNSSKTQGATPKDSPRHGESASQTVVVSADNSDAMEVQSSGGPVNTAKRGSSCQRASTRCHRIGATGKKGKGHPR